MADLIINGKDAYSTWGVRMGDGFLDSINTPCQMKDYIENDSRLEHGKRVLVNPKLSSRTITLPFTIQGATPSDYKSKKIAFLSELYKGEVDIQIPKNGDEVYHLVYKSGTSYSQNRSMTFSKFSAKFEEPNPFNRV